MVVLDVRGRPGGRTLVKRALVAAGLDGPGERGVRVVHGLKCVSQREKLVCRERARAYRFRTVRADA
jgi:hypothetical protein